MKNQLTLLFIALFLISCSKKVSVPMCMHDNSCTPDVYYGHLLTQCADSHCCEASVKLMKQRGYQKVSHGIVECSDGLAPDMMKCVGSLRWCGPKTK